MSLRQRNKARVRSQILEASAALITELGVEPTTTRTIAERAGVSYQTLYNYFPSKSAIVLALLENDLNTWSLAVDQVVKRYSGDLLQTLDEINRVGINMVAGEPHKRRLWQSLASSMFTTEVEGAAIASLSAAAHEQYHALLSLAHGMGDVRDNLDLHLMAHTLFCLSDYGMLEFFLTEIEPEMFLRNQREQAGLVITPYLARPPRQ